MIGRSSRREVYASVERQTGKRPPDADSKPLRTAASYIVLAYQRLNINRNYIVGDRIISLPLHDGAFLDHQATTGIEFTAWEIDLIKNLDTSYLDASRELNRT